MAIEYSDPVSPTMYYLAHKEKVNALMATAAEAIMPPDDIMFKPYNWTANYWAGFFGIKYLPYKEQSVHRRTLDEA